MSAIIYNSVVFTVPGEARGKGRPRATTIGGHARMYTDAKTASYENLVKLSAQSAMRPRAPFECPVVMFVLIEATPPKSASQRNRIAMLAGDIRPAKKPDLTNIVKAIEDGANGVIYRDDAQIVGLVVEKRYGPIACVTVFVRPYLERTALLTVAA